MQTDKKPAKRLITRDKLATQFLRLAKFLFFRADKAENADHAFPFPLCMI